MKHLLPFLLPCLILCYAVSCRRTDTAAPARDAGAHLYVTWETLETDKVASIWLIKRFVDKDAEFRFVPKGTPITNGIPFDTPDSELRRYHSLSCFQSILGKYDLTDPSVLHIGDITHDIEINFWGEKRFPESSVLNERIQAIVEVSPGDPEACLAKSFVVLDELLARARDGRPAP